MKAHVPVERAPATEASPAVEFSIAPKLPFPLLGSGAGSLLGGPGSAVIRRDATAAAVTQAASARAVTIGDTIHFGPEMYRPDTADGRELIAHELVHVAQGRIGHASGPAAEAAAEREARELAPRIARNGWSGVRVRAPAIPVACDRIPDQDLSQDRKAIREELERRHPWLHLLAHEAEIVDELVERIAAERQLRSTTNKLNQLPDPRATYLSDEIERREAKRRPVYKQLDRDFDRQQRYRAALRIDLAELLSREMLEEAKKFAGVAAAVREIKNHSGSIVLDRNGLDSFRYGLFVKIDGTFIPVENDGIHLKAFFADAYLNWGTAEVQRAFYEGTAKDYRELAEQWVDLDPSLATQELETLIAEGDAARMPARALSDEEQQIDDYHAANKAYADTVKLKTQQAVAPLVFVLELFAIDGPVDLLLSVVPVEKIGAHVFKLGKKALAARKARKLEKLLIKEFEENLDEEAKAFLKLARGLSTKEVRALKTIHAKLQSPALIRSLMERSLRGTADLEWLAKKLEKNKVDSGFVRSFTLAESGPSWQALRDVVEKDAISAEARAGLAAQLKGLLGEEAASTLVKGEQFAKSAFKGRKSSKVDTLLREVPYGAKESLDLVGVSDKAELVFGEVKHWSADTWAAERKELFAQLDRHNAGIPKITAALSRRPSDVAKKIVFVSEEGFKGMTDRLRKDVVSEVTSRGWELQLIPDANIGTFGELVDKLR